MTREEARRKAIEVARGALALARTGAPTGLSDGRRLTGRDAVLFWERKLRALETGPFLATAPVASDDGPGFIAGSTAAGYAGWESAVAYSITTGSGAEWTYVEGTLQVELVSSYWGQGSSSRRQAYTQYLGFGAGDEASANGQVYWDYNWQAEWGLAMAEHTANYGEHNSWTLSSANF